jgi:hypothetical protein
VSRLLVDRPRIALEGAFVAAVIFGIPLATSTEPIAAAPIYAVANAKDAIGDIEATVEVKARSVWASAQAFVVQTSAATTSRLRQGTFARSGASGHRDGMSADPEKTEKKR